MIGMSFIFGFTFWLILFPVTRNLFFLFLPMKVDIWLIISPPVHASCGRIGGTASSSSLFSFFFVADTRLSAGHLASGVRGHSGPESRCSMNWVTYSFMRARHVSMQGTLRGGGGFVATAHVMQWCRLPQLFHAHHSKKGGCCWRRCHVGGARQGVVPGRSVEKHTSSGGGIGFDIPSIIIPSDGGSRKLDTICEVQGCLYWGPCELYCASVPLGMGAKTFVTHAPW